MDTIDLVLEGGGVKGIALVGAVAALDRAGYRTGTIGRKGSSRRVASSVLRSA